MKHKFILLLLAVMIMAGLELTATAQSLKVGMTSKTLFYLPFYVGLKKGFYNAENLKVELIFIGRSDVQLQALIAGEINFGALNSDGVILVNEKGGNLKVIAGVDNAAPYILVGGKAYKKIDDLRGARIGVSGLRGGATSILVDYLKSKALQYPRDYTFAVISGGTTARLSALETGAIAAGILGIPYSDIAIDQGFNRLGDTMEVISTYQFNGITVNPPWAEKNRATVVKFLKAHIRSLRWIHEQPDQATELFTSEMGVKQPYARRGIDYFTKNKVFPIDGSVTLDGLKVNIDVQFRDGVLKEPLPTPDRYADQSFVRQAQKELGL
ncbi:MAG TPA: ABC transporter substrate-binding protein [Candidatus Binatia bacterium]|jgi:ABC-type nitrate/sulfonate/bicarbonate transport system substrate-binding protein|nr:ABC transporter substrate-binding protein [Candidatus Binatia bacterium]